MEPVLRTCTVAKGRICAVCFDSISAKKKRKSNFHEVKDNVMFMNTAKLWTEYEHEYASVFQKHDPSSMQKLHYHHKCQMFFDERHRLRQVRRETPNSEMEIEPSEHNNPVSPQQPELSMRQTRSSGTFYETQQ